MSRTLRTAGDRALLIDCADLSEVLALSVAIRAATLDGVIEVVPAAQTVLLNLDRQADLDAIREAVAGIEPAAAVAADVTEHEIPVRYDGEDLQEVAELLGITAEEVIDRHTSTDYMVAFGGFAPGFAYLVTENTTLEVPRRSSPRTRIPAGSVGLAGIFSGIYPRESPGGWQLIGTSGVALWDSDREPAALLQPGDRVRFVQRDDLDVAPTESAPVAEHPTAEGPTLLSIRRPGLQGLIQDLGRPDSAGIGAPPSGVLDRPAMRMANWLVGNPLDAAVLEFAHGGVEIEAVGEATIAIAGATAPVEVIRPSLKRVTVTEQRAIALSPGDVVRIGTLSSGARSVVALRHGVAAHPVAGSVATDTLSGIGPAPLKAGDEIRSAGRATSATEQAQPWPDLPTDELTVPVVLGPRDDWFTDDAVETLFSQAWSVSGASDRVGMRLEGDQPLTRAIEGELLSEGVVTGSLQVPANGQPVLFLNDHPVTGGYPVIGVVHSTSLPALAQVQPGMTLRFTRTEP